MYAYRNNFKDLLKPRKKKVGEGDFIRCSKCGRHNVTLRKIGDKYVCENCLMTKQKKT